MEQSHQPFDLSSARDILTILFKHKYKILFTFLVITIGVTIFAFYSTRVKTYESKSVILVKFGREFMARPEEGRTGQVVPQTSIIAGEIGILKSRDLLTRVVKQIGPAKIYPSVNNYSQGDPTDIVVNNLEQSLVVENIRGSNLIQLTFVHGDATMAAAVLNILVDLFKEKHLEVFSGEGSDFLKQQLEASKDKMRESEKSLADFRQKYRVFSLEDQRTSLLTQRNDLDTRLKAAENEIKALQQKMAFIKGPRYKAEPLPEIRTALFALEQREKEMLLKYKEDSWPVQNIRAEIKAFQEQVSRSGEGVRQAELSRVEGELDVAQARYDGLRRQLGQVEAEIRSLDSRSREWVELRREAANQEQSYQALARKFEEAQVGEEMDRHKMVAISVVEEAIPNSVPKKGRFGKRELIPMGFFGGIGAGLALAFMLEFMAPCMTTPWSAERRLNLPVMAAIRRLMLSSRVPVDVNPTRDSANSEMEMEPEMIALYQTITAALPDIDHRIVLFVGSRSNEGTSTIARQLARVASLRMEKSVLLIDLDRSRPDLHVFSKSKPEINLQDSPDPEGQIELSLARVEGTSLYVMPLFWRTMITPKTIDYAKRDDFWESLKNQFDLIIVDSPPATMFPDGPAIVSRVDGVILVVEAEKTRWQVVLSVKEKIMKSGGNILGLVFNKRRLYIPEVIYRYL